MCGRQESVSIFFPIIRKIPTVKEITILIIDDAAKKQADDKEKNAAAAPDAAKVAAFDPANPKAQAAQVAQSFADTSTGDKTKLEDKMESKIFIFEQLLLFLKKRFLKKRFFDGDSHMSVKMILLCL